MRIVYAATPLRLYYLRDLICRHIRKKGHFPLHPFLAFPYEEYNPDRYAEKDIQRARSRLIDICDEFWLFGIDETTLDEAFYAQTKRKPISTRVPIFDRNRLSDIRGKPLFDQYIHLIETIDK